MMDLQEISPQKAPGRKLLLVSGILLILFNGFLFWRDSLTPYMIFATFVGVMGVVYCGNVKQAKLLLVLSLVSVVAYALYFINGVRIGFVLAYGVPFFFTTYVGIIIMLPHFIQVALQVLYIVGAVKNLRFLRKEE